MSRSRILRRTALVAGIPLLVVLLSGCVFPQRHGQEIEQAAQAALDDKGIVGGVEAFNTSEGMGDTYSLLICVEAPAGLTTQELAVRVADTFNAVREVADEYSGYLDAAQLRLVDESVDAPDLDSWCREEDGVPRSGLIPLQDAGARVSTQHAEATVGTLGNDIEFAIPYAMVAILAEEPPE